MATRKRIACMMLMLTVVSLLTGCKTWDKITYTLFGDKPDYIIHLHTFTGRRTKQNEMNAVEYSPGKFAYLDRKPLLTSINASKIEVIERPGGKGLKLTLDGHGKIVWTQTTAKFHNPRKPKSLIVMLDKTYKGSIKIDHIEERGIVLIPGPFTDEEIENIQENAAENRRKF